MTAGDEEEAILGGSTGRSKAGDATARAIKGCGCVTLTAGAVLVAAFFGLQKHLSDKAIQEMLMIDDEQVRSSCQSGLDMSNITYNIWWPGCGYVTDKSQVTEQCTSPCYSTGLLHEMDAFNKANPGTLVSYRSRRREGIEDAELTGWWLPAPSAGPATPRIVLQHGFKENSNQYRQQLMAYMLRSMGISVLLNNFRDHGYSARSEAHVFEWGHSYPYDTLGAWDFAVTDPDGKLGGRMAPSMVGLQGFSKGAFTVMNALGAEGQVPGAWVDSGPASPKVVFAHGAANALGGMGLGFMAPALVNSAWRAVIDKAREKGIDLNKHVPATELPRGPDSNRPVFVVGNARDNTVPIAETETVVRIFKELPRQYDVKGVWINENTDCLGDTHCNDHIAKADEYKRKVCAFWAGTFGAAGLTAIQCPEG